jgi:multimeric flavodoxin WrbA
MSDEFKVLTLVGSPNGVRSNTLAFANDFLDDVEAAGLVMCRTAIVLSDVDIQPCRGCWNCTMEKPCPLRNDDLAGIKQQMIDCDMLVLASPVYTNQVSAQMKALFDRLFTWCHVFPLLGKYGLSVTTTGNDGYDEVGRFLEKMLATYGISSFGSVVGTGAYTPGFFPRRESERAKYKKLARRVAETVRTGKMPPATAWRKKMFKVMKRKLTGVQLVNYVANGPSESIPDPTAIMVRMIRNVMKKRNVTDDQVKKLSRLMLFELRWWADRDWLSARTFDQLAAKPVPEGFAVRERLVG